MFLIKSNLFTILFLLPPHRAMHLLSSPSLLTPPFPRVFSSDLGEQGCLQSRYLAPGGEYRPAPLPSALPDSCQSNHGNIMDALVLLIS